MKTAVYYNNKDIRIEEIPIPEYNDDEILVQVKACGICGSDVMEWYRIKKAPLVLGHELTGDIVEVGKNVEKFKIGDRVVISHHIPCNTCRYCLNGNHTVCDTLRTTNIEPGGFAEYVKVPKINVDRGVFKLSNEISYEEGSFIEPLGCVIRGQRIANMKVGKSVLVLGSGISGLLHIQLAKTLGATSIIATDINDYRLDSAMKFGANAVINAKDDVPNRLFDNLGKKADLVILSTGAKKAIHQALNSVDRGGTILFFAPTKPEIDVGIPLWELWKNGINLTTSYAASPSDLTLAMELIRAGNINVKDMISHKFRLEDAGKGFELVAQARESIKVIIQPGM